MHTFGDRKNRDLPKYFDGAEKCFRSIARICDQRTLVVQMVAFADPVRQLPRYLKMLDSAGFREVYVTQIEANGPILKTQERLWRQVPNRGSGMRVNAVRSVRAKRSSCSIGLPHRKGQQAFMDSSC